jgi:hypothetical protein
MSLCPNKSSREWKDLSAGLTEKLAGKSAKEIDAVAHVAFILKGDGTIPAIDEAVVLLTKNGKKQFTETVKTASKAFKLGAEEARKEAFLAGQMRQGRDMAPKIRALEERLAEGKITEAEYKERIKELEYEGRFKEAEAKLAAEIEGKKAGRKEGVKEQTAFQKEFAKRISDFIKASEKLRGVLSPKQVESVVRKAASVGTSDKALSKFTQYFEKIVSNANYDKDLSTGVSLQKKLVKPFAEAAALVKRMKNLPLEYLSAENLTKFNELASAYVASTLAPTSTNYRAFDVAATEKLFKPIEDAVNDAITADVEAAYGVLGLTNEEALVLDEFMSSEDMDMFVKNLAEAKKKALRTNLEKVADYSLLGLKEKLDSGSEEVTVNSIDEVPKQYRDSVVVNSASEATVGKKIIGLPIGKETKVPLGKVSYTYTIPGQESIRLQEEYGKDFVEKLRRISEVNPATITDNNQLAELIKTVDNVIVNNSNANVGNVLAIVQAIENSKNLVKATNPVIKFIAGNFAKLYYDTPIVLQRIFGSTGVEASVIRLTEMDAVVLASTSSEKDVLGLVEKYKAFRKKIKLDNSAEADVTMGVYADLINVKKGSEDDDFLNNKAQLEQSIDESNKSTDPEDKYIGGLLKFLYDSSVKESNTLADFKKRYSEMHPKEVEAVTWMGDNAWKEKKYANEFKRHAEEDLNETFDADERENYYPRSYKRVKKGGEEFDITENIFTNVTLKPKETGRSKERKLINTLPKNKVVDYRFEYNTFKTLQEQLFTSRSHLAAKTFHYMSRNDAEMEKAFGGNDNQATFVNTYRNQYQLFRYGKTITDNVFKSTFFAASRIAKDLGSSIVLGSSGQVLKQATPLVLAMVKNIKYTSQVLANNVSPNIELFNLAPVGAAGIQMGAAGRSEGVEALMYSKTQRGAKKVVSKITDFTAKIRELSLTPLTNTDVYIRKKTFAAYYLQYMNEVAKVKTSAKDLETEHKRMNEDRRMALAYAQQSIDKTQATTVKELQSELKRNDNGNFVSELAKNIVLPFNNFSSNTKARTIDDMQKIIYGNKLQKSEAALDLTGSILEMASFQAVNIYIIAGIYRFGIKEVLEKAFDIEDDEEFYDTMSNSFKKFYTGVIKDFITGGLGTGTEESGIKVLNRAAYMIAKLSGNAGDKSLAEWLSGEPTFQPTYKPKTDDGYSFLDFIGAYAIPIETIEKSAEDISAAVSGTAMAPKSFELRKTKKRGEVYNLNITTNEVDLTEEQRRFFLFMGIANGISGLTGLQDAEIIRAGERLKANIKKEERKIQYPMRKSAPKIKGGIKTPKAGTGGLKTGR